MQFQAQSLFLFVLAAAPSAVESFAIPRPWLDLSNGIFPSRPGGWAQPPARARPSVLPTGGAKPTDLPLVRDPNQGSGFQLETKETLETKVEKRALDLSHLPVGPQKRQIDLKAERPGGSNMYYMPSGAVKKNSTAPLDVQLEQAWITLLTNVCGSVKPSSNTTEAKTKPKTTAPASKKPTATSSSNIRASSSPLPNNKTPAVNSPNRKQKSSAHGAPIFRVLDLNALARYFIADGHIASAAEVTEDQALVKYNTTAPSTKKPKTVNGMTLESYLEQYFKRVVCKYQPSGLDKRRLDLSGGRGLPGHWNSKAISGGSIKEGPVVDYEVAEPDVSAQVLPTATATRTTAGKGAGIPRVGPTVKPNLNLTRPAIPTKRPTVPAVPFKSVWASFVDAGCALRAANGTIKTTIDKIAVVNKRNDSPDTPDSADTTDSPDSPDGKPETPETPEVDETPENDGKKAAGNYPIVATGTALPTGAIPTRVIKPTATSAGAVSTPSVTGTPTIPTGAAIIAPATGLPSNGTAIAKPSAIPSGKAQPKIGEVIAKVVELACDSQV